jgi:hypothetical protein
MPSWYTGQLFVSALARVPCAQTNLGRIRVTGLVLPAGRADCNSAIHSRVRSAAMVPTRSTSRSSPGRDLAQAWREATGGGEVSAWRRISVTPLQLARAVRGP